MSKADAVMAVGRLVAAFRQEKLRDETIEVYADQLQDIGPEVLARAVSSVINECKFMPAIAEIRQAAHAIAAELQPKKPDWLLEPGPDDEKLPLCEFCMTRVAYLEMDGKRACPHCKLGEKAQRKFDFPAASGALRRGDSWEAPEPEDDDVPPAEV